MRSRLFGLLAAAALTTIGLDASAYCRTTTCDPSKTNCDPLPGDECTLIGKPLFWPNLCTSFNLQQDASPGIPYDTFAAVTHRAFLSWLDADCGGGVGPSIEVHDLGAIACNAVEYNQYAGNANIIMFRTQSWPYTSSSHTLALTTVTFNTENAHIYDVDIEVNAAQMQITTGDDNVQYDLEAILAHELGHFFGLAHSRDSTATMYSTYKRGTVALRTPEQDDHDGMCAIYPVDRVGAACDPTPRRGLKTTCGDGSPPDEGGCSVGPRPVSWPSAWWLVALGLVGLGVVGRQRGSQRPRG